MPPIHTPRVSVPVLPIPVQKKRIQSDKLTGFEQRVVLRLAKGGRLRFQTGGHARLGAMNVPASLIGRLSAADLLDMTQEEAGLSRVGAAFAARLKSKHGPGKEEVFANQHREMVTEEREVGVETQKVQVNKAESPLWWLRSRKDKSGYALISDLQFAAGERLRQDWEMAQLGPRICMSWSDAPPDRGGRAAPSAPDLPPGALRAKERVSAALDHCGLGLGDILVRVCCQQEGLTEAEHALKWPRRSGKLILTFGLEKLVDFYGLRAGR